MDTNPTRTRSTAGWLALVGVAALGVGLLAGPALGGVLTPAPRYAQTTNAAPGDQPPEHTISVVGSGKVTLVPDMATVNLGRRGRGARPRRRPARTRPSR